MGRDTIWLLEVDGFDLAPVTGTPLCEGATLIDLTWSPDAASLAYACYAESGGGTASGSSARRHRGAPGLDRRGRYLGLVAGGDTITWRWTVKMVRRCWGMRSDAPWQPSFPGLDGPLVWSPDGGSYVVRDAEGDGLLIVDESRAGEPVVVPAPDILGVPSWQRVAP